MTWRVLEYQARIWARLLREEPARTCLPPVVTLVVHHGESGWTAPRSFHQLVEGLDELPELAQLVPDFEILVDDLVTVEDAALSARAMRPLPRVALWLLRDGRDLEAFFRHLASWADELRNLAREADHGDVEVVLRYILHGGGEASYEAIRDRVTEVAPEVEETMASAAEQLIQRGLEQGLEQGLERGRQSALRTTLDLLLRQRFGALSPAHEARLAEASADQLEVWIAGVLNAGSVDEALGG